MAVLEAFDSADHISPGKAKALYAKGYRFAGLYARTDRTPAPEVHAIRAAGLKIWFCQERGEPTAAGWFSGAVGKRDAADDLAYAKLVGLPVGKPFFAAVDYNASIRDLHGPVRDYFDAYHAALKEGGYLVGVYGSGLTCETLIGLGICHLGWRSQSMRWSGTRTYTGGVIDQLPSAKVLGLSVDGDTVKDQSILW